MDDDILATALDKLPPPPPMVQSRRPEAPLGNLGLGLSAPTSGKDRQETNPPSYAELLNKIDHSQSSYQQQQQEPIEYYDDHHEHMQMEERLPPPTPPKKQRKMTRTEELTYAPPRAPHPAPEAWWWKHKRALLVGAIVVLMLVYGIPKIQTLSPTFSTQVPVYKLSHVGAAAGGAVSAALYAVITTYVLT